MVDISRHALSSAGRNRALLPVRIELSALCALYSRENAPSGDPADRNCWLVGEREQGSHPFDLDCKYRALVLDDGTLLSAAWHRTWLDHGRVCDGVRTTGVAGPGALVSLVV